MSSFFILGLMLEGGIAFNEALPKAVAGIKNSRLREQLNPALAMADSGASVAATLAKVPIIDTSGTAYCEQLRTKRQASRRHPTFYPTGNRNYRPAR